MLKDLGPEHGAFLRHVANDKNRHAFTLQHAAQFGGHFPDLEHRADCQIHVRYIHGLDRVNHHIIRLALVNHVFDAGAVGFGI